MQSRGATRMIGSSARGNLEALFGDGTQALALAVAAEQCAEEGLQAAVWNLAQVSLLYFSIDIVAVRAVGRLQILRDGNKPGGSGKPDALTK